MISLFFTMLSAATDTAQTINTSNIQNLISKYGQAFILILFVLIFYFMIIRPQNKQKVAINNMIDNLKIGDKIITKGGIIGKICEINNNEVVIELFDKSKIQILKHAIISLINDNKEKLQ